MLKTKAAPRARMEPLADGQVWHMPELRMQVDLVGKLLVHYKLAKHNAVRIPNSIGSITSINKFLKKNKAVLLPAAAAKTVAKKNGKPAAKTAK
jgi:hypothetical protein